jgi:hypothetical protein
VGFWQGGISVAAHKLLSASRIKNVPVSDRDQWLTDDTGARGTGRLMLRVSPGGVCRWYFRMPRAGNTPTQLIALGDYSFRHKPGALTLSEAREMASAMVASIVAQRHQPQLRLEGFLGTSRASGHTPPLPSANPTPPSSPPLASSDGVTLLQLCRGYVDALTREKKYSARRVSYEFERLIAPRPIAQRLARDIQPAEFTDLLKEIIRNHGEEAGKNLRCYLSTAYRRAMDAKTSLKDVEAPVDASLIWNPITQIRPPEGRAVRDRVLKNSELRGFWGGLNGKRPAMAS